MTSLEEDKTFLSQLDEASKAKAKKELNERNDKDRDAAVQTLRQWVLQQQWLKSPTDYAFLLRFLRVRKFSQLEARKILENYWTLKSKAPKVYMEMDPTDAVMLEILRHGIFISTKNRDKDGCRVLLLQLGRIPADVKSRWGVENMYKAFALATEWVVFDENCQVNGLKMIWEYTNISMSVVSNFVSPENNQLVMKFTDKCIPARVKAIYTYNEPPFVDFILSLFLPFLSQKLRDRLKMTGKNLSKLYKYIDKNVLPEEYLPDDYAGPSAGSEQHIIEEMITDMTSKKFMSHIQEVTSLKYGVDLKSKPTEKDVGEVASFRKLNID